MKYQHTQGIIGVLSIVFLSASSSLAGINHEMTREETPSKNIAAVATQNKQDLGASAFSKEVTPISHADGTATLRLESNQSTGYSWYLASYNGSRIRPVSQKFIAPSSGLAGAPGVSEWTFHVSENALLVPQLIRVKMVYARPWDLSSAKTKNYYFLTEGAVPPQG